MSNDLQHKLYNYEVTPSQEIWLALEKELEQSSSEPFKKLFGYEEQPSVHNWNKIQMQLNAAPESTAKVVFIKSRTKNVWKVGVAAAILILALFGVNYFFSQKNDGHLSVRNDKDVVSSGIRNSTIDIKSKPIENEANTAKEERAKNNIADESKGNFTTSQSNNKITANRYTTMANDKGKVVRLSKKVIPVFNCADNYKSSNNLACKENIELLQHKMATSLISASADFGGLVDLLKDLKENN